MGIPETRFATKGLIRMNNALCQSAKMSAMTLTSYTYREIVHCPVEIF